MPAWRRIEDLDSYLELREKAMLEGALAYINELFTALTNDTITTLNELKNKISYDANLISGALSYYLKDELKVAGMYTGLFEKTDLQKEEAKQK